MRVLVLLAAVLMITLSVLTEVESSSNRAPRRSSKVELIRRRGSLVQRGRRKNIWSYNPGHRSLAFLVAGEVEMASPPPTQPVTEGEYRCLGCCGVKTPVSAKGTTRPELSNRVDESVLQPYSYRGIGTEPNAVNDPCLGCCEVKVTPWTLVTMSPTTTTARREVKAPTVTRQRPWQAQRYADTERPCVPPRCVPNWRHESSSSSEEMTVDRRPPPPRSRMQPIRQRVGPHCRRLGCRTPLGSTVGGDSSSSEED
ncbi:uncharacterized protein [Hyperolius riggenbachi]|uniref:uncharacterized protein isoform X2 n=1 Tax=Hyperolius riggenbachi TaxID=752182 RepID=UPI0035A2C7DC